MDRAYHLQTPREPPPLRFILHADLDAYYASVEQLDRPELRGKPVVVGGSPEERGVVTAASYEARPFGVRSGMPMSRALRMCPQAVRIPPRFDRYRELSSRVMAIFRALTPLVEPLSLDEAFLDVTELVAAGADAQELARGLKERVKDSTGLTVSIGAGSNKTIAKIASEAGKPDGLIVVPPGEEAAFLAPLPARALWGVGPKTAELLERAGIQTVGQIAEADAGRLKRLLGDRGPGFQRMARGLDERPVIAERERKSVGAETTFPKDVASGRELDETIVRLAARVAQHLASEESRARVIVLKLRYSDFRTVTRQVSLGEPTDDPDQIARAAASLLAKVAAPGDRFRLVGVQCRQLGQRGGESAARSLPLW